MQHYIPHPFVIISHLKPNGVLQPEIVSEQMINGLICNNFTFYRTLIGVHIWWAKLFKSVLILLIAICLFELLAPAGFGIMCLLLLFFKKYIHFMPSHCFAASVSYAITVSLLVFLLCCPRFFTHYTFFFLPCFHFPYLCASLALVLGFPSWFLSPW